MTTSESAAVPGAPPARGLAYAARHYLGGQRGLLVLAMIAALIGAGFSWDWLIAAGIAPIILAALPCLVMCGLGLCMNKLIRGSCATEPLRPSAADPITGHAEAAVVQADQRMPGGDACARPPVNLPRP